MRSLDEIQNSIIARVQEYLPQFTSTSRVAIWRLWVYIVAYAIWLHEAIVDKNAENSRPHTMKWYREQALNYIDGVVLIWDSGQFVLDISNLNESEINDRKLIDRIAVLESRDGELVIKVATDKDGIIQPLTSEELLRFKAYMNAIKDAGNRLRFINQSADKLRLNLTVWVDPLIIDLATGEHLTNGTFPVKEAINNYLAGLEFNGAFVKEFFRDAIQKADGVKLPKINQIQTKYAGWPFTDLGQEWEIPQAGYYKIEEGDLTINYLEWQN